MSVTESFVRTTCLEVAFEERGDPDGAVVLLLHGWPDDVRTWDAVAERLAGAGYRTIAPYLRGFGPTRFLDPATIRSGQLTAIALDAVELLDALRVSRCVLVGHDWGARAAYVIAALWPERVERLVTLSVGYGTNNNPSYRPSYDQARRYWYHWFFHLDRGREALEKDRRSLCLYLWRTWMPSFSFDEAVFERTARSWDNPDWVDVTLHSYRHRWQSAAGDPRYDDMEERMTGPPLIRVPTLLLQGDEDGANSPATSAGLDHLFAAGYRREVLCGVGHFPSRERPELVADAILGQKWRVP
jgi:pimeloyl-ACP methyl ester carboxylesterase